MAKGTNLIFNQTPSYIAKQQVDVSASTWKCALISQGVNTLTVAEVNPKIGSTNITEVTSGGGYSTGGITLTLANVSASSVFTFAISTAVHTSGKLLWSALPSSPTNIKTAVIYDATTISPTAAAVCFIDVTDDGGSTAVDLTARDLEINFGGSAVNTRGHIFRLRTSN